MGTLTLIDGHESISCSLTNALEHTLADSQERPIDFTDTLIVLPTQRLITFFAAELATKWRGLHPPQLTTLDRWLEDLIPMTPPAPKGLLSLWLAHHLANSSYQHLCAGQEGELLQFFSEIETYGLGLQAFDQLSQILETDIYKNDSHLGSLTMRFQEMKKVYQCLQQDLLLKNLQSASQAQTHRAAVMPEVTEALAAYRRIWLAGFTTLSEPYVRIFQAILPLPHVSVWLHKAPPGSPLAELAAKLEPSQGTVCGKSQTPAAKTVPSPAWFAVLPSPLAEVRWATKLAQKYVSAGTPPSQIAIIVTHDSTYAAALGLALSETDLPHNLALTRKLSTTPFGQALAVSGAFFADGDLRPLISHPLWQDCLGLGSEHLPALIEILEPLQGREPPPEQTAGFPKLHLWLEQTRPLRQRGRKAPLSLWGLIWTPLADQLWQFWQQRNKILKVYPIDLTTSLNEAYQSWKALVQSFDFDKKPILWSQFWRTAGELLIQQEIRLTGEPLSGIQVISLAESRNIAFKIGIVIGCQEGAFPKALPKDELVDDHFKRALGLPGWRHLEKMEDLSFYLLRQQMSQLILTCCQRNNGDDQIKSRFIESLLAQGACYSIDSDQLFNDPSRSSLSSEYPPSLPECQIHQPIHHDISRVSATKLKYLLSCPYRYRLESQKISDNAIKLPPPPFDPIKEGSFLHGILERFIRELREWQEPPPEALTDFVSWSVNRLMELSRSQAQEDFEAGSLLWQLQFQSWPRFAEHLINLYGPGLWSLIKQCQTEWSFSQPEVNIRDHPRILNGTIDRIDYIDDMIVVTDYKRRIPPTLAQVKDGKEPQLALYAHAVNALSTHTSSALAHMVLGYFNIIDGEWLAIGVGDQVRGRAAEIGLINRTTPNITEILEATIASWRNQEELIEHRHGFFADPTSCGYCDLSGICRKDDPAVQSWLDHHQRGVLVE